MMMMMLLLLIHPVWVGATLKFANTLPCFYLSGTSQQHQHHMIKHRIQSSKGIYLPKSEAYRRRECIYLSTTSAPSGTNQMTKVR